MNVPIQPNDIQAIIDADRSHVWHHLIQHKPFETIDPRIMVEGRGMRVWDATGKEHLDAVSGGVWTVNVGYGRESIANAVRDQLVKMNYFANSAGSIPGALFAQKLIEKMPGMSRVYYSNSGSEANEKAFKMVRQIAHKKYGGKKHKILYRDRDYHGTTITCLSAGGQDERNVQYGPFTPGFIRVPHCLEYRKHEQEGAPDANYGEWAAEQIEQVILREGPDTVGALCLEPVTAGGGVIVPPEGYWQKVQDICDRYDILLGIDWKNADRFATEIPLDHDSVIAGDGEPPAVFAGPSVRLAAGVGVLVASVTTGALRSGAAAAGGRPVSAISDSWAGSDRYASCPPTSRRNTNTLRQFVVVPVNPERSSLGSSSARRYSQPSAPSWFSTLSTEWANRASGVFAPLTFKPFAGAGTTLYSYLDIAVLSGCGAATRPI